MGKLSRDKGKRWEREVAKRLRAIMPGANIRRGIQSRGGGAEAADVVVPCMHVEAKHGAAPSPWAALEQAEADAGPGLWPVAVLKRNRERPVVVMSLEDFEDLIGEWWERGQR